MQKTFKSLAELCEKLEATDKRLRMISLVADFLKELKVEEVEPAVSMILGRYLPRWSQQNTDVSWVTLRHIIKRITKADDRVIIDVFGKTGDIGSATKIIFESSKVGKQSTLFEKKLTITEVRKSIESIAKTTGPGSREKKERLIEVMFSQASPVEAKYLVKIFIGEMRIGFSEGLIEQAVSKAFEIPLEMVQKGFMITGDIGEVSVIAKRQGKKGLSKIEFKVFRPVRLMLAQMANDIPEVLREHGKTAFEYKLDGVRVQIHKLGEEVKIFSRRLKHRFRPFSNDFYNLCYWIDV